MSAGPAVSRRGDGRQARPATASPRAGPVRGFDPTGILRARRPVCDAPGSEHRSRSPPCTRDAARAGRQRGPRSPRL